MGKTTILNIIYFTISKKFHRLKKLNFQSLDIVFFDGSEYHIDQDDLRYTDTDESYEVPNHVVSEIASLLSPYDLDKISQLLENEGPLSRIIMSAPVRRVREKLPYSGRMVYTALKSICGTDLDNKNIQDLSKKIDSIFSNVTILYFPTFRRIEEDLLNLGFDENKVRIAERDSRLVQFGMRDVVGRFESIQKEINILSSRGLSQISSEILSQLVRGIPSIDEGAYSRISPDDIEIILARVGDAISQQDKDKILQVVTEKKSYGEDDKYLIYFLDKLVQIYDKQRFIDTSIEKFVKVCNQYLKESNKGIVYEASEVEFYLVNLKTEYRVKLNDLLDKLSSGEKQIVSLFSRIYLSTRQKFIVLFDEPELSLSIFWQQKLLPDIIDSGNCELLISVTHSPFIFDNELASSSIGLEAYTTYIGE